MRFKERKRVRHRTAFSSSRAVFRSTVPSENESTPACLHDCVPIEKQQQDEKVLGEPDVERQPDDDVHPEERRNEEPLQAIFEDNRNAAAFHKDRGDRTEHCQPGVSYQRSPHSK